ncbi:hypothetical protein GW17_00043874 [Ensete ventricosum]|nr:hypothetical protein GW17_00043874 [Ensete ventricosum]RZS09105.1 hypothetical protein BHM03_00040160 [Ensete ventricosum]
MDFGGVVDMDMLVAASSDAGSVFSSSIASSDAELSRQIVFLGSSLQKNETSPEAEDHDMRCLKLARTDPKVASTAKVAPFLVPDYPYLFPDGAQMLSFSSTFNQEAMGLSPDGTLPYQHHRSAPTSTPSCLRNAEPGRCRRTDGKKWRCSREAVADQKYCERHINRGRHRSRKHVEGCTSHAAKAIPSIAPSQSVSAIQNGGISELGHMSMDSLLKPQSSSFSDNISHITIPMLNNQQNETHPLRRFTDDWSRNQSDHSNISGSEEYDTIDVGLGAAAPSEASNRQPGWLPISWESSMAGPLGEVLNNNTSNMDDQCRNLLSSSVNFLTDSCGLHTWLEASPTGILQKTSFCSVSSSTRSSPRVENHNSHESNGSMCDDIFGSTKVDLPTIPS